MSALRLGGAVGTRLECTVYHYVEINTQSLQLNMWHSADCFNCFSFKSFCWVDIGMCTDIHFLWAVYTHKSLHHCDFEGGMYSALTACHIFCTNLTFL